MSAGPLVIKVGGTTLEDQGAAGPLWAAVVAAQRGHAGGVVLVHGGGKAVDRHVERLGFRTERREGIRITPADQLDEITAVLAGRINKALVGRLNASGARAVGLCLGDGGAVPTTKTTRYSFDPGRVGEVAAAGRADEGNLLRVLLRQGFLPVLCSIGIDSKGEFLNVNADDAAAGLVGYLGAAALILTTDVPGILDERKQLVREITPEGIEGLIASGAIGGGMLPKARAAAAVTAGTGVPVVILSGNDPASLTAYLSGKGVGTRIVPHAANVRA